jgi:hypothetical protein
MAYTKRPLGDFSTSSYSRVLNQLSRITEKSRVMESLRWRRSRESTEFASVIRPEGAEDAYNLRRSFAGVNCRKLVQPSQDMRLYPATKGPSKNAPVH